MIEVPAVRYARSGDIDIAYQVFGQGSIDLVFIPGFVSHRELIWELPYHAVVYDFLSSFARVVSFDKRGTGLSDRSLGFGSVADRMDDIRAVLDAAEIERTALYGVSEGGPMAILFAATYPDRVTKLALGGTYARMLWAPDYPTGTRPEKLAPGLARMRDLWGTGEVMRMIVQDVPDDAVPFLARYERNCCTPHMVEEIMRRNTEMDVRAALPAIAAPTLVMHATGDPVVPVRHARFMAEHIPGARYMEYEAASHATWQVDLGSRQGFDPRPDLRGFFVGESDAPTAGTDRVLATVVFTDIVASTEQGAAVGDSRWRELLDHHDRAAQSEVARFKGRLVKSTGDGVLATFDGPARGIKCAQALGQRMAAFGLDIRAGVHTGEIELRGADVAGLGVAIARRICDLAERGELLASRTVKDLVAGSGIAFADRGPHQLKGVPDDWQLFAVG